MVHVDLYQVDAFSAVPFAGNPAAVALLRQPMPDGVRQQIAAEMNLAETAFVEPLEDAQPEPGTDPFATADTFRLRWFTPTTEVPLCGHATLASAAALFNERGNSHATLHFETRSGRLSVTRQADAAAPGSAPLLQMSLPLHDPVARLPPTLAVPGDHSAAPGHAAAVAVPIGSDDAASVAASLAAAPAAAALVQAAAGQLPLEDIRFAGGDLKYVLLVLAHGTTRGQLEGIQPDFGTLLDVVGQNEVHGVIVSCAAEPGEPYDVYARFFGPWMGINEDPVTGSAFCVLAPYWARRLGKQQLRGRQCSPRGGDVGVLLDTPAAAGAAGSRVVVCGSATTVLRGVLVL